MYTDCDRDEPNNTDRSDNDISYKPTMKYAPVLIAQAPITFDELTFCHVIRRSLLCWVKSGSLCAPVRLSEGLSAA
jgi:hypothetical protein